MTGNRMRERERGSDTQQRLPGRDSNPEQSLCTQAARSTNRVKCWALLLRRLQLQTAIDIYYIQQQGSRSHLKSKESWLRILLSKRKAIKQMPEKTIVLFHQLEAAAAGQVWFALATNQNKTLQIVSVFPRFPSETSLLVGGNI